MDQFDMQLAELKNKGLYVNPTHGYWERTDISPETEGDPSEVEVEVTVGDGSAAVYAWYLPAYRELSEKRGAVRFPMKVGRTSRDAAMRVQESAGYLPEKLKIGFSLKTDNASEWESLIHAWLKLAGRHIDDAVGTEWFNTSPEELKKVHSAIQCSITGVDPSQSEGGSSCLDQR